MARVDFTTLARVKVHLEAGGAAPVADEWETYLERVIDDVSAQMETYLSRGSSKESRTEYLDVEPGQHVFSLTGYPGVTITSVTNDDTRAFSGSTVSVSDYAVDSQNGLLLVDRTYALIPGWRVLKVVYTGGLASNTTALVRDYPDLAHAADLQVVHQYRRRTDLGSSALSIEGQSRTWTGAYTWLPPVVEILDRYRRVTW